MWVTLLGVGSAKRQLRKLLFYLNIYGVPKWFTTPSPSRGRPQVRIAQVKRKLEKLSWRYAALIGIVTPESAGMTEAEVSADRERWPHLMETEEGIPVLHLDNGTRWMAEVSGAPVAKCRRVLSGEWG
jgi:hypothetical protein